MKRALPFATYKDVTSWAFFCRRIFRVCKESSLTLYIHFSTEAGRKFHVQGFAVPWNCQRCSGDLTVVAPAADVLLAYVSAGQEAGFISFRVLDGPDQVHFFHLSRHDMKFFCYIFDLCHFHENTSIVKMLSCVVPLIRVGICWFRVTIQQHSIRFSLRS